MDLKTQLVAEEGRRNKSYPDTRGIWTIGIGHVDPSICEGIIWNDAMIDATFALDVATKTAEVSAALPWFRMLSAPRQAVLLQMAFQMGTHGLLGFPAMLASAKAARWQEAGDEMMHSLWATQTPQRAKRLAEQMRTGQWQC